MSLSICIIDSRPSYHMSYNDKSVVSLNHVPYVSFMIDDDTLIPLANIGFVTTTNMSLFDVYYIPSLTSSLNCVRKLCDYNYSTTVSSTYFCVHDSYSRRLIGTDIR